VIKDVSANPMP